MSQRFLFAWNPTFKTYAKCFIPGYKTFQSQSLVENRMSHSKCFIPGYEAFCVCFIRGISCKKKSLWQAKCFILWYPPYVGPDYGFWFSVSRTDFSGQVIWSKNPVSWTGPGNCWFKNKYQVRGNYIAYISYRSSIPATMIKIIARWVQKHCFDSIFR